MKKLESRHVNITLSNSSSDIVHTLFQQLLKKETIKILSLSFTPLTLDFVHLLSFHLMSNASLQVLHLTHGSINDDGVNILACLLTRNKALNELYLSHNPDVTSACARSLQELVLKNDTLSSLALYHTKIEFNGVLLLIESLMTNHTLRSLRLDMEHQQPYYSSYFYLYLKDRCQFF